MDREYIKNFIIARAAKEIRDGDIVNLGIGMPTMLPKFLPENVKVTVQAENGLLGVNTLHEGDLRPDLQG